MKLSKKQAQIVTASLFIIGVIVILAGMVASANDPMKWLFPSLFFAVLCLGSGLIILKGKYKKGKKIEEQIEVPSEIASKRWHWGAFVFSWIWAVGNRLPFRYFLLSFLFPILMNFVLAINGYELAWRYGKWKDIKHFEKIQRAWTIPAIAIFIFWSLAIVIGLFVDPP